MRRRRRAAAHACPGCRRPWALRGARAGGAWLFTCRYCSWSDVRGPEPDVRAVRRPPAAPWVHGVHLYDHDSDLVRSLADHLTHGWAAGGVGFVVATPEHRAALHDELARRGLSAALRGGRLVELDAEDTLRLFMRNGSPDPVLFQETVGALVREHAAGVPLRAFGEMVDLLWEAGSVVAALELEQLWGDLQRGVPFSLLCGYASAHLDDAGRQAVCAAHDHRVA